MLTIEDIKALKTINPYDIVVNYGGEFEECYEATGCERCPHQEVCKLTTKLISLLIDFQKEAE